MMNALHFRACHRATNAGALSLARSWRAVSPDARFLDELRQQERAA
jgi:hypothetical protein